MNYGILPTLTKDYILSKISQEAIFEKYLGIQVELDVPLKSPPVIRSIDNNPTCQFYMTSNGKLKFRDMAGYFWGDCFDAVAHVNRLNSNNKRDFNAILEIIARDFRIHKYEGKLEISTGNTYDPRDVKGKKEKTKIEFKIKVRNWIELDARFWKQGNVSRKELSLFEVYPCQYIWKNNTLCYNFNPHDPAYAYHFGDGNFQFYFPFRKEFRFMGNSSGIRGIKQFEPSKIGLITKSYKDIISLKSFGVSSLSLSSETSPISKVEWSNVKYLAEHWFSLMDYDRTGILMAAKLRKEYNIQPLFFSRQFKQNGLSKKHEQLYKNYPDYGVKDFFEYGSKFGQSLTSSLIEDTEEKFEDRFKQLDEYYYNNLNWLKYEIC